MAYIKAILSDGRIDQFKVIIWGGLAAFCVYFSMYAFRKPFAVGTYEIVEGWHYVLDFKITLLIAQVSGYAISKVIGIKVISEMRRPYRVLAIFSLIGGAWVALVLFAIIPPYFKIVALFFNGLLLGMIWGLVYSYLEGRRTSEVLGAILCASFIVSSGMVKSVGKWLMQDMSVSEFWMPAATGAIFIPLLCVSVLCLNALSEPTAEDVNERMQRRPMHHSERMLFLREFGPGIGLLVLAYILFTAFRDFRDNFAAELWIALGDGASAAVFTISEVPVAIFTLIVLASLMGIRDNIRALVAIHIIMLIGTALLGISTYLFAIGHLSPVWWMILSGSGLYFAYTPFNCMLFDRLIAASQQIATAGFLIYVADSAGYLASVSLMLYRNFGQPNLDWISFFTTSAYCVSIAGGVFTVASAFYFTKKLSAQTIDKKASC